MNLDLTLNLPTLIAVTSSLVGLVRRFTVVEGTLEESGRRLERLQGQVERLRDDVEQRNVTLKRVETRLDGLAETLASRVDRDAQLDQRVERLEGEVRESTRRLEARQQELERALQDAANLAHLRFAEHRELIDRALRSPA